MSGFRFTPQGYIGLSLILLGIFALVAMFVWFIPDPGNGDSGRLLIIGIILIILGAILIAFSYMELKEEPDADTSLRHPIWFAAIIVFFLVAAISAYLTFLTENPSGIWPIVLIVCLFGVAVLGEVYIVDTRESRTGEEEEDGPTDDEILYEDE